MPSPVELSGIAGIEVHLAGSTGRENNKAGLKYLDAPGGAIEHVGACAAIRVAAQPAQVYEVDGDAVIE